MRSSLGDAPDPPSRLVFLMVVRRALHERDGPVLPAELECHRLNKFECAAGRVMSAVVRNEAAV